MPERKIEYGIFAVAILCALFTPGIFLITLFVILIISIKYYGTYGLLV